MKKMTVFKVLVALVLCVVGVGFYQGWFILASHRSDTGDNKVDVNLTVDGDKARADAKAVGAKVEGLIGNAKDAAPHSSAQDDVKSKDNERVQELGHQAKEETGDAIDRSKHQNEEDPGR